MGTAYGAQNVKLFINDCFENLKLDNFHSYYGEVVTQPPPEIKKGTTATVEYTYARFPALDAVLDGNINYYGSSGKGANDLHMFFNVNTTGGVYAFVTAAV